MELGSLPGYILRNVLSPWLNIRAACRLKQCNKWLNAHVVDGVVKRNVVSAEDMLADMRFTRELIHPNYIPPPEHKKAMCLCCLSERPPFDALDYLLRDGNDWSYVIDMACLYGKLDIVKWLYARVSIHSSHPKISPHAVAQPEILEFMMSSNKLNKSDVKHLVSYAYDAGDPVVYARLNVYYQTFPDPPIRIPNKNLRKILE